MCFFDERAADWDTPGRVARAQTIAALIGRHVPLTHEMRVIDVGAGTGLLGLALLPNVDSVVLADPSEGMVAATRQKIEAGGFHGASALVYDVPADPPPGSPFDLVTSLLMLHHVKDMHAALRSCLAMLRPGGRLALVDLDAEDGSFHRHETAEIHHHGFGRDELLSAAAAAGFGDVTWQLVHELEKDGRSYPLFLLTGTREGPTR